MLAVARLLVRVVILEAFEAILLLAVVISPSFDVIAAVFEVTVLVRLVTFVAFCVTFPFVVAILLVNVVISLALAVILVFAVVILVAFAAIRLSGIAVHTFGLPDTKIYALLPSSVSNHSDPTGSETAGADVCLKVSGFPVIFVVFVLTVPVKEVTLLAFWLIDVLAVAKLLVSVVILDALAAAELVTLVISVSLDAILVVFDVTVAVKLVISDAL